MLFARFGDLSAPSQTKYLLFTKFWMVIMYSWLLCKDYLILSWYMLYPVDETRLLFSHHFHAAKYEVPCPYCNTFFAVFTLTSTYQRKVKRWVTTVTVYFGSFSVQVVSHNYIVRLPNTKVTLMTCLHKTPLYCVTFSIVKRVNTA